MRYAGNVLSAGRVDDEGACCYPFPAQNALDVVVDCYARALLAPNALRLLLLGERRKRATNASRGCAIFCALEHRFERVEDFGERRVSWNEANRGDRIELCGVRSQNSKRLAYVDIQAACTQRMADVVARQTLRLQICFEEDEENLKFTFEDKKSRKYPLRSLTWLFIPSSGS